jgi:hypothetical protein
MNAGRRGMTAAGVLVCGFTLVIAGGIAVSIVLLLRRLHRQESTVALVEQIGKAVEHYVADYHAVGIETDSSDFITNPWRYLFIEPHKKIPGSVYLDLPPERLLKSDGRPVVSNREADQIKDFFGYPIRFKVSEMFDDNHLVISSTMGTPMDSDDDFRISVSRR